jgi:site-specific DNA recombinase
MNETQDKQLSGLIYYRVSTEEQATFGVSLEQQENSCRKHVKEIDGEIDRVFHDDGVSAKTTVREGLQAMLAYCAKNYKKIDFIIVYKVDRLSRNVNDYSNILVLLNKLNIKLISVTEAIDETPVGQFIGNFMAANAQLDNQIRGERVRDCMQTKLEKGYWQWKAPTCYKNTKTKAGEKIVTPDPERRQHAGWIFDEFAKGIFTLEEVRVAVNERGLRTEKGNEISPQLISKIIRNVFYTGRMVSKGKEYKGLHEPLVSMETFNICQALLKGSSKADAISKKRGDENFPLRHQVICGFCGRPITASLSTGKSGAKYPYYRCYFKECPTKVKSIPKDTLEQEFADYLAQITPKQKFLKAFKAVILDVWDDQYETINQERKRLTVGLDRIEEEKKALIGMKKKELIGDDDFKEEFSEVKDRIAEQHMKLSKVRLETFNIDEAVDYVFGFVGTLPETWVDADFKQKQQLQSLIFPEKPVYTYSGFETPVLSPIFGTKKNHLQDDSILVTPRGIEPRFQG